MEVLRRVLVVDGLEVEVVRKRMKTLRMVVQSPHGNVRVSAPARASEREIRAFVTEKRQWIDRHRQRLAERPVEPEPQYLDGECVPFEGELLPLRVVEAGRRIQARRVGGIVELQAPPGSSREQRKRALDAWYRRELEAAATPLFERWQAMMGIEMKDWRIRDMKSRWGSCKPSEGRICLNLQLMKQPPDCLEYVVVHELAHLLESGHGPAFVAVMDRHLPGWRAVRARLNGRTGARRD